MSAHGSSINITQGGSNTLLDGRLPLSYHGKVPRLLSPRMGQNCHKIPGKSTTVKMFTDRAEVLPNPLLD